MDQTQNKVKTLSFRENIGDNPYDSEDEQKVSLGH